MYIYVYIYMYIHMYVHMYVHTYVPLKQKSNNFIVQRLP